MSDLETLLNELRKSAKTEREKGTYFENLCIAYLRNEASYQDLYNKVCSYSDWAKQQNLNAQDTGIDLVAETTTGEVHAIQCKFYAEDYRVQKKDIDSFFTASGKQPFSHRLIITTTNLWSKNAEDALSNQQLAVNKITLADLAASQIDWSQYQPNKPITFKAKKTLLPHQQQAITQVMHGFATVDRGKMIMACGTGKTFTSLKLAEQLAGKGERVLFLVPSLALLQQTLTEWTQESSMPLHSFAVCSDVTIGKKQKNDDSIKVLAHELRYPATTEADKLASEFASRHDAKHMSVLFATYHSIDVINKAQKQYNLPEFKLIICDEAHRTTGATFEGEDDSNFVKVHNNSNIKAKNRLYMTATPRVYGEKARSKATDESIELCSMDNVELYGEDLYVLSFSEAVAKGLLVDYKVIVLSIDEKHIIASLQNMLKDSDSSLKIDDAGKIVGCWKALSKQDLQDNSATDSNPMQRAVAFCQVIEPMDGKTNKTHKVSSKEIAAMFQDVIDVYQQHQPISYQLECQVKHVDGTMNATEKEAKISWLKAETKPDECKILSNVRCLTEGVDVPALDAVLFLAPRKSQIDVVQAVGRVMRNAPNKNKGYVILPVVVPGDVSPEQALNDNKTYNVVWEVLRALRSHDDRYDASINRMKLDGIDHSKMEVISITDSITAKAGSGDKTPKDSFNIGKPAPEPQAEQRAMDFSPGIIEQALCAKVVEKCGNRRHWEDWAKDIAKIAKTHIAMIKDIIENPKNTEAKAEFTKFANALRHNINDSISNEEVIEMLAQHLITKPVFNALFANYDFAAHNPISQDMQKVLAVLEQYGLEKETETLTAFYNSVKLRVEGTQTDAAKQKILVELYDKFFRNAFPNMSERLGIVYTPVEVVDFIIHSVDHLLKQQFNQSLASDDVHILDPFTGTGTFISRLLQSGLIHKEQLAHKYNKEIHANEIVLLAYYIAAINIEATYHAIAGKNTLDYQPFNGICLTDTFAINEAKDPIDHDLIANNERLQKQEQLPITVIIGNPPYSAGQKSANDNNQNLAYPKLDERILQTYAEKSTATLKNSLYDSYIRAIRWASDRIGKSGIIGFVTNAGFVDSSAADGMRKCLADEFSNIYVFYLKGNAKRAGGGELSKRAGGNVFDGCQVPVSIVLLVKNPNNNKQGKIYFYAIDDYLNQKQKREKINNLQSIAGISKNDGWQQIIPDSHGDWLNQRDNSFDNFIEIGNKKAKQAITIFINYSKGVMTARDAWVYNANYKKLCANMHKTIAFYNLEVSRYQAQQQKVKDIKQFLNNDSSSISWNDDLRKSVKKLVNYKFNKNNIRQAVYRPFTKQWLYYGNHFNHRTGQIPKIFPTAATENRVIYITGKGVKADFSILMTNITPDLNMILAGQCFPLYLYEENTNSQNDLFATASGEKYQRKDAISNQALEHFREAYPKNTITKEDIFYYIYGILHCPEYRKKYANNLKKQLPRIPRVKTFADFTAFSQAGRELAELHINYEQVDKYPVNITSKITKLENKHYYVTKMKFAKNKDKSTIIYNNHITISNIPLDAYNYVVNGKSAIEWVMERQGVSIHKDSGIKNDANDWAIDTMNNAKYPLELLQRVITVSLKTNEIINNLPKFDIK